MPTYSFTGSSKAKAPSGSKTLAGANFDLHGIDLTTPVDAMAAGKSPFAKNFRLYAQQEDSRRVAVSSRKGSGYLTAPQGQVTEFSETGTTDADTVDVSIITGVQGVRFQATNSNRLTEVQLNVSDSGGNTGTLLVEIWSDNAGVPAKKLAVSSISSGAIGDTPAYLPARFIKAVLLSASSYYWVIVRMQDDGVGAYTLSTTSDYTSYATDSTIQNFVEQDYGINVEIFTTPTGSFKGGYRFLRDNGSNTTMIAYGTTMYYLDEDNELVSVLAGLDSNAEDYRFAHADNKVFWVNGYDDLTAWDGTFEVDNDNLITNGAFESDITGWVTDAAYDGTLARSTAQYHSGVASLSATNTSGFRAAQFPLYLEKNHRYHVSLWVKVATAGSVKLFGVTQASSDYVSGAVTQIGSTLSATTSWQHIDIYYDAPDAFIGFQVRGDSGTGTVYIDDVSIVDTGISYILDTELEIASDIAYNKDRLWVRTANDPNRMQWCEAPGNPTATTSPVDGTQIATTASQQWYNSWRSVDYRYVPRPHNGSPTVAMIPFQDALTLFTQDMKYIVSGYDTGSYTLRESTGSKGAIGIKSVAVDENVMYFVAKDGFYSYDGSSDTKISKEVQSLFDACPRKDDIRPVVWKNQVRFYMASTGSDVNDMCLIWDKDVEEWMYDTDTYVKDALWYVDADDSQDLIEFSSAVPQLFVAEQDYSAMGAPIDFEYRFKYDSMGAPGQKKRIKRFVPILQGVDTTFPLTLAMDKDFEDSPKIKQLVLTVNGATLDAFDLGDGTILGGDKSFSAKRQSYSGYANYWQFRLARYAAYNRVAFVGAQYTYKLKRL